MLEAAVKKQLRDFSLDLSLRVENGEILVLMGDNGAGKSTTLNILAGLVCPDSGKIRINGSTVCDTEAGTAVSVEHRKIGYVFQRSAVFPHLTVAENIAFGLRAQHHDTAFTAAQVSRWIDRMNICDLAGVKASGLSGGQKQRVALARALATEPSLLMLDEPFSGLDTESRRSVKEVVRQCVGELKIPCIIVTHRPGDARDTGDRICRIVRGRIVWEGPCSALPDGR
ncbi:MAG: Molybdate/tungstate import ATP-binding protein WtpC [Methanoregula sp. PtaU1.Bin006]|uniref:sulfate/molybdate ABC transporter ATP-binding protein n=1 Tax=Methanoregula sp. PtaU1.Bin006 TaxID=1811681 RepID=UPI0009CA3E99|nr:ATP-binding cassette domain-containing protein [Methanoregula sp. PtaU1.Bin006]OPY32873.1 MAG: Molybdate/tungstate import ATP-binding protein WtpC [Methanoregula sp. PtaU1.Bin006]